MSRRVIREFSDAHPDVPVVVRVQEKTVQAFDRIEARLARGEPGAVGAVVRDARGFILLQRHDPATGWPEDQWAIPGGGVNPDEEFPAAVARETFEETGLRVEVGDPLLLLRQKFVSGKRHADYPFVFYACRPLDPRAEPKPRGGEVVACKWFHRLPKGTLDRDVLLGFMGS